MATEQLRLVDLPEIDYTYGPVALDALPPNEALLGPDPDGGFIADVKRNGILQPVGLCALAAGGYRVVWGRRRIKAARALKLATIPAAVGNIPEDLVDLAESVLTIAENEQRSSNVVADLAAVEALSRYPDAEVVKRTGFPQRKIDQIRSLVQDLHPTLLGALKAGKVRPTLAHLCSKRPAAEQQRLVEILGVQGKLQMKDLEAVRTAGQQQAARLIPEAVFDVPPTADAPPKAAGSVQVDTSDPVKTLLLLLGLAHATMDTLVIGKRDTLFSSLPAERFEEVLAEAKRFKPNVLHFYTVLDAEVAARARKVVEAEKKAKRGKKPPLESGTQPPDPSGHAYLQALLAAKIPPEMTREAWEAARNPVRIEALDAVREDSEEFARFLVEKGVLQAQHLPVHNLDGLLAWLDQDLVAWSGLDQITKYDRNILSGELALQFLAFSPRPEAASEDPFTDEDAPVPEVVDGPPTDPFGE